MKKPTSSALHYAHNILTVEIFYFLKSQDPYGDTGEEHKQVSPASLFSKDWSSSDTLRKTSSRVVSITPKLVNARLSKLCSKALEANKQKRIWCQHIDPNTPQKWPCPSESFLFCKLIFYKLFHYIYINMTIINVQVLLCVCIPGIASRSSPSWRPQKEGHRTAQCWSQTPVSRMPQTGE